VYSVGLSKAAQEQVEALPGEALAAFAELRVVLETAPWAGLALLDTYPDGPIRSLAFGQAGGVMYLILERQRRVEVLEVVWLGP
jgi:hypothetical protein